MAEGRDNSRYGMDRAVRASAADLAFLMLSPIFLTRLLGVDGIAVFSVMHAAAAMLCFAGELLWERPAHRSIRLLLRSEKYSEALSYARHISAFGFFAGAAVVLILGTVRQMIYGVSSELTGSALTILALLPGAAFMSSSAAIKGYLRARGSTAGLFASRMTFRLLVVLLPCILGAAGRGMGGRVDALLLTEHYASVYGAVFASAGMSLAMFISWLIAVISMALSRASDNLITSSRRVRGGGYAYISADGLIPLILLALLLFDAWRFFAAELSEEETAAERLADWGRFYGLGLSPAILTACLFVIPFVTTVYRVYARFQRSDTSSALDRFAGLIRRLSIVSLPSTAFLLALSGAIVCIVVGKPDEAAASLLRTQIIAAPLAAFSAVFTVLFKRLGGLRAVWISLCAGGAAHVLSLLALTAGGRGVYACVLAHLAGFAVYLVISGFLLFSALAYRQEWLHGLLIPLLSAAIAAAPMAALCGPLSAVVGEVLTVIILTVAGACLYMTLLTVMHGVTEYELYKLPGGRFFAGLSRLFSR